MSTISERLSESILFLIKNGKAKSRSDIARTIGAQRSAISMAMSGYREPPLTLLADFCDHYPIDLWWLYKGEGSMIRRNDDFLLLKIAELEGEIRTLREELGKK